MLSKAIGKKGQGFPQRSVYFGYIYAPYRRDDIQIDFLREREDPGKFRQKCISRKTSRGIIELRVMWRVAAK